MTLTAFLPTGAPQVLPFIGTPGAATVGHALVWSETPQGFTLAPISVGPDQFSGVLPVAKGGWGSNTGSFTSPGAIALAAGGTNQPITLTPTGTASARVIGNAFGIDQPAGNTAGFGLSLTKGTGFFSAVNGTGGTNDFWPIFIGSTTIINPGLSFVGWQGLGQDNSVGVVWFSARNQAGSGTITSTHTAFAFSNFTTPLMTLRGNGDATFHSTTESTSTTTGAVRINGGLGVAGNVNLGGNLKGSSGVNFANLPTASTGLTAGDLWRDSNGFLRIV